MAQKSDLMCCHVRGAWKVLRPGGVSVGEYQSEEEAMRHIAAVELEMENAEGREEKGGADTQQEAPVRPVSDTQAQEVSHIPFKRRRGRPRKNW